MIILENNINKTAEMSVTCNKILHIFYAFKLGKKLPVGQKQNKRYDNYQQYEKRGLYYGFSLLTVFHFKKLNYTNIM